MAGSQKPKSRVIGGAKVGAWTGAMVFMATHFIPLDDYKNVLDWMHRSVLLALNVTDTRPGTPGNFVGLFTYFGGFVFAIAIGAAFGAVVASLKGLMSTTETEAQPAAVPPFGQADGLRPPLSSNVEAVEKLSEPHLSRKARSMRTLFWIPAILCGGFFFRNKDYAVQLIDRDGNLQAGLFYFAFGVAAIIFVILAATGKKSNLSSKDSPRELEKQDPPR